MCNPDLGMVRCRAYTFARVVGLSKLVAYLFTPRLLLGFLFFFFVPGLRGKSQGPWNSGTRKEGIARRLENGCRKRSYRHARQ